MNVIERRAFEQSARHYDEMAALVDSLTIEIVDRRRRTAIVKRRGWLVRRVLLAADVLGLTAAFVLAHVVNLGAGQQIGDAQYFIELIAFLLSLPGWVVMAKLYGLYAFDERRTDHSTADDISGIFHLATAGAWLFFGVIWVVGITEPDFGRMAAFWGLAILFVSMGRALARVACHQRLTYLQNTVIVGTDEIGQRIAKKVQQHSEYGVNLVGFIDSDPKPLRDDLRHLPVLGPPERIPGIVRLLDIERVVIAFSDESWEESVGLIRTLIELDVRVDVVPRFYELIGPGVGIHSIEGVPLLALPSPRLSRSSRLIKRVSDLVVSTVGLVLLAPLFGLIALLIKLDTPGPVFFRQLRMGSGGKTFVIFKFRTMAANADARKIEVAHLNQHRNNGGDPRMFKIPADPRTTRVGAILRRYCLDELPQLINVVKGEMSMVGPRPLILDEDEHVGGWQRKRLDLKPGMTGLWQVLGRSDIPFEEMVNLDYLYVISWSLFNDMKLMLRTIPAVIHTRSAY